MFVVDVLHEVELGVWKSLFVHLVRILHGCGSETVTEFNRRSVLSQNLRALLIHIVLDFGKFQHLVILRLENSAKTSQA
jgi:hypothetical protein